MRRILPALGLVGAVLVLAACGGGDNPGVSEGGDLGNGRDQFVSAGCGGCHALEAAGTTGTVGPDLDAAFAGARDQGFEASTFQQVVRSQIAYPGIDSQMPPDLVTGQNADDVAYFVAQCAAAVGENPQCVPLPPPGGTTGGGEGGGTDGAAIFSANCASCHTLAAAGATGTIGPNLDDAKPSVDLAIDRVTNGMGVMPSFSGTLSEEQIKAVAQYVADNAGK